RTTFPAGFTPTDDMERVPDPPPAPGTVPPAVPGSLDFDALFQRLTAKVDRARVDKGKSMLRAERFQLFADVKDDSCVGVVRSQSRDGLVYSCRLAADGSFACCTQNLRPCGGLQGALCKHLLVLILGLAKADRLDPATVDAWVDASRARKPELDKDLMSETFL